MEKDKKHVAKISIFITSIFVIFLSITYAFLNLQLTGSKRQVITAGNLELEILEEDALTLDNALPMHDEVGSISTPYTFQLHNKLDEASLYTVKLKDVTEEGKEKLDPNIIRYSLEKDEKITKNSLSRLENEVLDQGRISGYQTIYYKLRLWVDSSVEDETLLKGKTASYRIEVEAQPILTAYQDEKLHGTDPVLTDSLVPVMIGDDKIVRKADLKDAWHDYENQKWANAVVLIDKTQTYKNHEVIPDDNIESYFVWIPRYRYKIFNDASYEQVSEISEEFPKTIEVEFESKSEQASSGTATGEWLTHPAFLAFDTNGFWVGKFETGFKRAVIDDADLKDSTNITIKPDIFSWRNSTVEAAFTLSYNYLRGDESHMMKNTEWGAVAYLQHSIYGSQASVRLNNNNTGKTGYAAFKEPTLGYNIGTSIEGNENGNTSPITNSYFKDTEYRSTTTGNITGIYDMAGGAGEYVMGYNQNATTVGGSSGIVKAYPDFFANNAWSKYYDIYSNETTNDMAYNKRILGDATGEMGPFANIADSDGKTRHHSSWYKDLAHFVTPSASWFVRGGSWQDGVEAGIFAFTSTNGGAYAWNSFRIVLTPSE